HDAMLIQDGNGNVAASVQVGRGCLADAVQAGNGNVAAIVQTCR
ncbi:MAG: curlin, partial [Nitratireductor sp.]